MKLSAFTPTGLLRLTSKPSPAESIYNSLANQYRDSGISIEPLSRADCTMYAQAMGMARAQRCLEKGWNQILPSRVSDLLDQREAEYGVVPGPFDTTDQRRSVLASRKLLPLGAAKNNIENALSALLGADFICYRPTKNAEVVKIPGGSDDPAINFQLASVPPKVVTLATDICIGLGFAQAVGYTKAELPLHPGLSPSANYIGVGDKIMIDAGHLALRESVAVTAATATTFTATFNMPHQAGAVCTTQPFPSWQSTQRFALIVLTAAAAVDPVKRQKVHDLLGRIARSVSTWSIVAGDGSPSGTAGPFVIGSSPLGATPLGTVTYP